MARFQILPHQRIPIPMRMRFFAEVLNAMKCVDRRAPDMRQARQFRRGMEKMRFKRLKALRRNFR